MGNFRFKRIFISIILFFFILTSVPSDIFAEPNISSKNNNIINLETEDNYTPEPPNGEIVDERTESTKTFYNGDGRYTEKIYFEPIHTKEPGEEYFEEISPDLVKDKSETNIVTTENTAIETDFLKSMANGKYANFTYKGHSLSLSILQAIGKDKPTLDAKDVEATYVENTNKIVHKGIFPTIDLQNYTFSQNTKEDLVLHQYDGYHIFKFKLETDLNAVIEDNSILLKDENNKKIFELPKPVMSDSNYDEASGETTTSDKVNYEIEKTESGYILTLNADPVWLSSPDRVFPIFIDPTTSVTNSSDSFVMSAYPTTNYSSTSSKWDSGLAEYILKIGNYDSSTGTCYAFINQSLPANLKGLNITSATFNAYVTHTASASATGLWLDRITETWSNSTVTWNSRPDSVNLTSDTVGKDQWASFDITGTAKSWLQGSQTNYGLKLHANGNGQSYWKKIVSTSNSNNNPYISVNYTIPTPDSPTGKAYSNGDGVSGYVDLKWDAVPGATGYKVLIFNGNNYDEFPVGNVTSWSTKGRKIWPSPAEIEAGDYALHHSSTETGVELPNDPSPLYKKNGNKYPTNTNYWFRIKAIYPLGESVQSDPPFKPTIPNLKFADMSSVKSYTRGTNGYIDLSWKPVTGATGYKFLMYNGKAFEAIDIGNVTSWTTKDKKYWPKPTEGYDLHLDNTKSGDELPIDPSIVYQKANPDYKPRYYVLKIVPYNENGETVQPTASYSYIPLITVPNPPNGVVYANDLGNDYGYANLSWDPIPGALGYKVWIFNGKFYESFDVKNTTSWTTKGKRIWPTTLEISNAGPNKTQVFHQDGKGTDLPREPYKLYEKMGTFYALSKNLYFRISAYDSMGETIYSNKYFSQTMPLDPNYEINPNLQAPKGLSGYTDYIDDKEGYVNLGWDPVPNAIGYKVWIYNGKEYQSFDVKNVTNWSTKDKGIWLTDNEISTGIYHLHTDGLGRNLTDAPYDVYRNANSEYKDYLNYFFKISAYDSSGKESSFSEVYKPTLLPLSDDGEYTSDENIITEEELSSEDIQTIQQLEEEELANPDTENEQFFVDESNIDAEGNVILDEGSFLLNPKHEPLFIEEPNEILIDSPEIITEYPSNSIYGFSTFSSSSALGGMSRVRAIEALINGAKKALLKKSGSNKISKTVSVAKYGKLTDYLKNYRTKNLSYNNKTYKITKTDMNHFLERHHTAFWSGRWSPNGQPQTFFKPDTGYSSIETIINKVLKSHGNKVAPGARQFEKFEAKVDGIDYVVGINFTTSRITQFFPRQTYIRN